MAITVHAMAPIMTLGNYIYFTLQYNMLYNIYIISKAVEVVLIPLHPIIPFSFMFIFHQ